MHPPHMHPPYSRAPIQGPTEGLCGQGPLYKGSSRGTMTGPHVIDSMHHRHHHRHHTQGHRMARVSIGLIPPVVGQVQASVA